MTLARPMYYGCHKPTFHTRATVYMGVVKVMLDDGQTTTVTVPLTLEPTITTCEYALSIPVDIDTTDVHHITLTIPNIKVGVVKCDRETKTCTEINATLSLH